MSNTTNSEIVPYPEHASWRALDRQMIREVSQVGPVSFSTFRPYASRLEPPLLAVVLDVLENLRRGKRLSFKDVWLTAERRLFGIMYPSIKSGLDAKRKLNVLDGDWTQRLSGLAFSNDVFWRAHIYAIAVQEHNAGMGLIAAAPTAGAAGVVPATILAVAEDIQATPTEQVKALLVAGLIGLVAATRGSVSGAAGGCSAEIGIACLMAAAAAVTLYGGGWQEVEAAVVRASVSVMGLECSPERGCVEFPCIPRNGDFAMIAVAAARFALTGVHIDYTGNEAIDRVFKSGQNLPVCLRETENGRWMSSFMEEDHDSSITGPANCERSSSCGT